MKSRLPAVLIISFATIPYVAAARDDTGTADGKSVNFSRDILPILSNKCFVCHGPDARDEDQLRLDSYAGATADRGGYQALNSRQPGKSELLVRIHSTDDPMPPLTAEKQLSERERELLSQWVRDGGAYSRHWAFVPPVKAILPVPSKSSEKQTAIDFFILNRLQTAGFGFADQADRATLARRAALVLTGLPPTLDQLDRFLADTRTDAYQSFVDELLASSQFGEHQARYWLDAVRYGDTHGLHLDNRRGIYPYRDWVVRSFNSNLPLNTFIQWQISGDLIPAANISQLVATGYVRLNPSTGEGGAIPAEFQMKNNFDRVETLGTVFLGLSLTCARCHNHKYDPIAQRDYYSLLAFFNSTAEPPLDGNRYEYGPTVRVPRDQPAWDHWAKIQQEKDSLFRRVSTGIENVKLPRETLEKWQSAPAAERLKMLADPGSPLAQFLLTEQAGKIQQQMTDAQTAFTTSLVARDIDRARETRVLRRGAYDQPVGAPVEADVPPILGTLPGESPRNRLSLAAWLTAREHPLVARVLVNRLWQRVFGAGLVRTPEDFGLQGQQPTHPQLLDWLAVELHDSQWNLKHMLRLMVTSQAFRQQSAWRRGIDDPENRLYARGPGHRLDAEVLRDIGLWASGLLDPHMGGEGVKPYQPSGMWKALAHPGSNTKQYVRDKGSLLYRRSLYVYWKRTSPHPMMTLFDAPDREFSCVRRSRTSTAQQSLGLLNETQRIEMARKFAERLIQDADSDDERSDLMFRILASRSPTAGEKAACRTLLQAMLKRYLAAKQDAVELLSVGEAPRNEALNPAEHAAWTQLTATVLASDISILLY